MSLKLDERIEEVKTETSIEDNTRKQFEKQIIQLQKQAKDLDNQKGIFLDDTTKIQLKKQMINDLDKKIDDWKNNFKGYR